MIIFLLLIHLEAEVIDFCLITLRLLQIHCISAKNACHCRSHCDNYFQNHVPKGFLHCHNFTHLLSDTLKYLTDVRYAVELSNSSFTSKHGHALIHSSGSISPFPFLSGLRSLWPHTRQPGNLSFNQVPNWQKQHDYVHDYHHPFLRYDH